MGQVMETVRGLSYLGGLVSLGLAVLLKFVPLVAFTTPRALLGLAAVCFLCSLASREAEAAKPKEEPKAKAVAA